MIYIYNCIFVLFVFLTIILLKNQIYIFVLIFFKITNEMEMILFIKN